MPENGNDVPSIDELIAKVKRLEVEVGEAQKAETVAVKTFADAIKKSPDDVQALLELSTAVATAKATVAKSESAVNKAKRDIDGIKYDEKMAGVTKAIVGITDSIRTPITAWLGDNGDVIAEFSIDTLAITAKVEPSGTVAISVKPSGENMPKRPSGGGGGTRGAGSKRSVTSGDKTMTCREYVASCGDQASPAAQADLAGNWDGQPISYTNEAKRLAAKNSDTFN